MPAVSFYLPKEILDSVREAARKRKSSVSSVIQQALAVDLRRTERTAAKKQFARLLHKVNLGTFAEVEKERTRADGCRN